MKINLTFSYYIEVKKDMIFNTVDSALYTQIIGKGAFVPCQSLRNIIRKFFSKCVKLGYHMNPKPSIINL